MLKAPEDTSAATKLRLAAGVVKAVDLVTEEQTKVSNVREETMNSVVQFDSDEFSKVSNKNKDEVITDMEKDIQNQETAAKLCIDAHDEDIKKAEKLATLTSTQAVQALGSTTVDQWTQFRPQSNLEPQYLKQGANHLEVSKFCQKTLRR